MKATYKRKRVVARALSFAMAASLALQGAPMAAFAAEDPKEQQFVNGEQPDEELPVEAPVQEPEEDPVLEPAATENGDEEEPEIFVEEIETVTEALPALGEVVNEIDYNVAIKKPAGVTVAATDEAPDVRVIDFTAEKISGNTVQLTAQATADDEKDDTLDIAWAVDDAEKATIVDGLVTITKPGTVKVTAKITVHDNDNDVDKTITSEAYVIKAEQKVKLELAPTTVTLTGKTSQTVAVTVVPDGTEFTISGAPTKGFFTAEAGSGSVKITGIKAGTEKITVSAGSEGNSASATLNVTVNKRNATNVSINRAALAPDYYDEDEDLIKMNLTGTGDIPNELTLAAKVLPTTSTDEIAWTSTNKAVATVDPKTGEVKAVGAGTTVIKATAGSRTDEIMVEVSATAESFTVEEVKVDVKKTAKVTPTLVPENSNSKVTFAYDDRDEDAAKATYSFTAKGNTATVTGLKKGEAYLKVSVDGLAAQYVKVTVRVPVSKVTLDNTMLTVDDYGVYDEYKDATDADAVKTIAEGDSPAPQERPIVLTATVDDDATTPEADEYEWKVTKGDDVVNLFQTDDGNTAYLIPLKAGTATVTVTVGGKTATCNVTVKAAVNEISFVDKDDNPISKYEINFNGVKTYQPTLKWDPADATDKTVTYASSDEAVAKVETKSGKTTITALKTGTATITATTKDGDKTADLQIVVANAATGLTLKDGAVELSKDDMLEIEVADSKSLTADASPENVYPAPEVKWHSSNEAIATVSDAGVVTGKAGANGVVTITAYIDKDENDELGADEIQASVKIRVGNKYTINFAAGDATNNGSGTAATGAMTAMTVNLDSANVTVPGNTGFTLAGYQFDGWKNGTTAVNTGAQAHLSTAGTPVTLTAQWKPVEYKISYVLNGAEDNASNPTTYNVTTADITLQDPTVSTGYEFDGWYADATFRNKVDGVAVAQGSTGGKVFYAKVTAQTFNVKFDANTPIVGSNANGSIYATIKGTMNPVDNARIGQALPKNTLTATKSVFMGWSVVPVKGSLYADTTGAAVRQALLDLFSAADAVAFESATGIGFADAMSMVDIQDTGVLNELCYQIAKKNSGALTLYAVWLTQDDEVPVVFNANGGAIQIPEEVDGVPVLETTAPYGKGIASKAMPVVTRAGYRFDGWYTVEQTAEGDPVLNEKGEPVYLKKTTSVSSKQADYLLLFAKWTPYTFTIAFNKNQVKANKAQDILADSVTGSIASIKLTYDDFEPTADAMKLDLTGLEEKLNSRNNYTLVGWSTSPTTAPYAETGIYATTAEIDLTDKDNGFIPTKNNQTFTLYAVWNAYPKATEIGGEDVAKGQKEYKIAFELNGGVVKDAYKEATLAIDDSFEYEYQYGRVGAAIKLPTKNDIDRIDDGYAYTFQGWYNKDTKKAVTGITNTTVGDMTLEARWTATKVTVNYIDPDDNNETKVKTVVKSGQTFKEGAAYKTAANAMKKNGEVLMGWTYDEAGAEPATTNGGSIDVDHAFTGGKLTVADGAATLNLYAVWEHHFDIALDDSDAGVTYPAAASTLASSGYEYGDVIDLSKIVPEKGGYTFSGWYKDSAFKTKITKTTATTSGDLTLYPKFTPKTVTVMFYNNAPAGTGVKAATKTQTLTYDAAKNLTANSFKVTGYDFKGWSVKDPDGVVADLADKESLKVGAGETYTWEALETEGKKEGVLKLYAVWAPATYQITYVHLDLEGKKLVATPEWVVKDLQLRDALTAEYAYSLTESTTLDTPHRDGYVFKGFYTAKSCTEKAKYADNAIPAKTNGAKTIYVRWEREEVVAP